MEKRLRSSIAIYTLVCEQNIELDQELHVLTYFTCVSTHFIFIPLKAVVPTPLYYYTKVFAIIVIYFFVLHVFSLISHNYIILCTYYESRQNRKLYYGLGKKKNTLRLNCHMVLVAIIIIMHRLESLFKLFIFFFL